MILAQCMHLFLLLILYKSDLSDLSSPTSFCILIIFVKSSINCLASTFFCACVIIIWSDLWGLSCFVSARGIDRADWPYFPQSLEALLMIISPLLPLQVVATWLIPLLPLQVLLTPFEQRPVAARNVATHLELATRLEVYCNKNHCVEPIA